MTTFVRKDRAVNSKHLLRAVTEFVEDGITTSHIMWMSDTHRDAFVTVIEDLLFALEQVGRLSQGNVVCDARNNKASDMDDGVFHLDISFKQANCVNVTTIEYIITVGDQFELPDFDLIFP